MADTLNDEDYITEKYSNYQSVRNKKTPVRKQLEVVDRNKLLARNLDEDQFKSPPKSAVKNSKYNPYSDLSPSKSYMHTKKTFDWVRR